MSEVVAIPGLIEIYENYDLFILDQWGVMHDGKKGYNSAIKCIDKLIDEKKLLSIISNSSKRKKNTVERLSSLGFNQNDFSEIMTSGEMVWNYLANKNNKFVKNLEINCFYIHDYTNEDGKKYIKGLEKFNFVDSINDAHFILACTPFPNKKVIDYYPILEKAKNKNLPFICANPDFSSVDSINNSLIFCMGAISEMYKAIGGKSIILGKPSIEIYLETLKEFDHIKKNRILAIGDSLYHDIQGARNFGIDSLLITSTGIHGELFDKKYPIWETKGNTLKNLNTKPKFICSEFKF